MSYTVFTLFPDAAKRDQMADFLTLLDWDELRATEALGKHSDLMLGEDMPQVHRGMDPQRILGFQASTLPHWAWGLTAWMAVKGLNGAGDKTAIYLDGLTLDVVVGRAPNSREKGCLCTDKSGIVQHHADDQWGIARRVGAVLLDEHWLDSRAQRRWFLEMDLAWERDLTRQHWAQSSQVLAARR